MFRSSARLLLVIALLHVAPAGVAAQDLAARIDRYLAGEAAKRGIPGLTAAVVRDGQVIYAGAHGAPKRGGRDTGFHSYLLLLPDDGIGVVLVSNWEGTPRETLVNGIVDLVLR